MVPVCLLATCLLGQSAIEVGGLLKQRLLAASLQLEPEEVRHQGAGQFLGQVIESQAIEALALSAGVLGLAAVIQLLFAVAILSLGAGGWPHAVLLLGWLGCTGFMGWRYVRQRRRWTGTRLTMTHELIEHMVGHRTRLVQAERDHWHDGEDDAMAQYLSQARPMDRWAAALIGVVPRGWMVLGLLGLGPAWVSGSTATVTLAVGLGGVLLAYGALHELAMSLVQLTDAVVAWQSIAPLLRATTQPDVYGSPDVILPRGPSMDQAAAKDTVLEARDLVFRYREAGEAVLRGCRLRIQAGDRILLQGTSGSGKSTLAALLAGRRQPQAGLLLLRNLDHATLGSTHWRQRVATAPQFHDNHVLTGTFAFNLLLGRGWPPRPCDLQEADALCRELGLGELLDRMPAGLQQMVGETGWQLSHGEQSRLSMARALLQRPDVVVLDESFAALDPDTLRQALQCVQRRAPALLVIAHP